MRIKKAKNTLLASNPYIKTLQIQIMVIIIISLIPLNSIAADKPVLRILNWSEDYIEIDPSVDKDKPISERSPTLQKFSQKYGCNIQYDEYDTEDEMLKKLLNLPHYYDVLITTSDTIDKLRSADKLSLITSDLVPNKKNILPKYASIPNDQKGDFFIPYLIGTTGIVYRQDLVGHQIQSWKDYFEPSESMKEKIACLNTQYVIFFAMQFLGINVHTQDREEIKRASKLFFNLRKKGYLSTITNDIEKIQEMLSAGDLAMAICYSGESLAMVKNDSKKRIQYVVPQEGAEYFMDCMTVLNDAPQKQLAFEFLNFFHDPEIQAANAISLNYATANFKALEIIKTLDPDYFSNTSINIPPAISNRLEIFSDASDEMRNLWQKITEYK
ncbi:MAG: spermidine/putrescine ABC transporter substrate-binding protein [Desulfobacterales bacterium]|nr:spermidine/putrescine ABC transporter substrate-binding protein [Desulfobacterales bacterium]